MECLTPLIWEIDHWVNCAIESGDGNVPPGAKGPPLQLTNPLAIDQNGIVTAVWTQYDSDAVTSTN